MATEPLAPEQCSSKRHHMSALAGQFGTGIAMLGSIGAGRLAAGLVELAVDGPARLVWLTST